MHAFRSGMSSYMGEVRDFSGKFGQVVLAAALVVSLLASIFAIAFGFVIIGEIATHTLGQRVPPDGAVLLTVYMILLGIVSVFAASGLVDIKSRGAHKTLSWTWGASAFACIALVCGITSIGGALAAIVVGALAATFTAPALMRCVTVIARKLDY